MPATESLRPLTTEEVELLRWMFAHGSEDLRAFQPQLQDLRAARSCNCGCPSIRLEVAGGVAPVTDSGERLIGDFAGRTARGESVGVLLFQQQGNLTELEVYSMDGLIEGEFDLPTLESMKALKWEPSPLNPNIRVPVKSPKSQV